MRRGRGQWPLASCLVRPQRAAAAAGAAGRARHAVPAPLPAPLASTSPLAQPRPRCIPADRHPEADPPAGGRAGGPVHCRAVHAAVHVSPPPAAARHGPLARATTATMPPPAAPSQHHLQHVHPEAALRLLRAAVPALQAGLRELHPRAGARAPRCPCSPLRALRSRSGLTPPLAAQVLPSLRDHSNETLLKQLFTRWGNHKLMVRWLSRFFNYLDRWGAAAGAPARAPLTSPSQIAARAGAHAAAIHRHRGCPCPAPAGTARAPSPRRSAA